MEFPSKIAESFERGQPYIQEIKKTLFMDHIPERYYSLKRHLKTKQGKEKKYHNNVINS